MDEFEISADVRRAALEVGGSHPANKPSDHSQSTAYSEYNPIEPDLIEKDVKTPTQVQSGSYGLNWSIPVDKLSDDGLREQYKLLARHIDTYPTREEVEKRIQDSNYSIEYYNKEYAAINNEVTNEGKKLSKLRKRLQAAQDALAVQMALIERKENAKKRVHHMRAKAAQDRFAAQISLDSGLGSTSEWLDKQKQKRIRLKDITKEMQSREIL